jgi:hypothetical protein
MATEALDRERQIWSWISFQYVKGALRRSIEVMELFIQYLRKLRSLAEQHERSFRSEGITKFCATLRSELSEE